MAKPGRKRKTPEQQAQKVARSIGLAPEQRQGIVLAEVSNRTDADQRHMIRSDQKETVRKLTRVEKLQRMGLLSKDEAQACEWYAAAHALGYETLGITSNYMGAGGGGNAQHCLAARYRAQQNARDDFAFARAGLDPILAGLLDRVLIHGRPLGRLRLTFRRAVERLCAHVGHLLAEAA